MAGYGRMTIMSMSEEEIKRVLTEERDTLSDYTAFMMVEELKRREEQGEQALPTAEELEELEEVDEDAEELEDGEEDELAARSPAGKRILLRPRFRLGRRRCAIATHELLEDRDLGAVTVRRCRHGRDPYHWS